jgi:hypothetical protein
LLLLLLVVVCVRVIQLCLLYRMHQVKGCGDGCLLLLLLLLLQVGSGCTPSLTKLCLGVHEYEWDLSGLAGVAPQLVELELHNPFLK